MSRPLTEQEELRRAHLAALEYLRTGGEPLRANLGTGTGSSVRQVIDAVSSVTGMGAPPPATKPACPQNTKVASSKAAA